MPPGRSARCSRAFAEIDQLRRENQALTQRVSDLEQANLQIPTMIIENQRLAELLKVKSSFEHKTVAAIGHLQRLHRRRSGSSPSTVAATAGSS